MPLIKKDTLNEKKRGLRSKEEHGPKYGRPLSKKGCFFADGQVFLLTYFSIGNLFYVVPRGESYPICNKIKINLLCPRIPCFLRDSRKKVFLRQGDEPFSKGSHSSLRPLLPHGQAVLRGFA